MSTYKEDKPSHLDEALASLLNQTVKPDEIILVEDGPVSAELNGVAIKYQNKFAGNFRIIKSNVNKGLGAALNLGLKYVTSDWIARADSDDINVKNRFELQLNAIQNNPNLDVVGGQIDEFSGNVNNIVGHRIVPKGQKEIKKFLKWRNPFNHPTVMIKKSTLCKVGGYQNRGKLEDYFLWVDILGNHFNVLNLQQILVHMRVSDSLYKRRGDMRNLRQIFTLKAKMHKYDLISIPSVILGELIMLTNILVPSKLRKIIYTNFIHK